jgi:predicted flap endonuclease-1-like 5' DNA nuclease
MTARVRTNEIPLDARERRMIGAGLLVLILSLGGAAAAFFALWRRKDSRPTKSRPRAMRSATVASGDAAGTTAGTTGRREDGSDDLKLIEGIGPRTEEALNEAGIKTFAQLAKLRPDRLEAIMRDAGTMVAKRDTWPEQARLAAAGDWDALRALQDQLKAGAAVG